MRVLIAEDDATVGRSLERSLAGEGYTVDWVRDGVQAETALSNGLNEFQVTLLDWDLPGKSGMEVLQTIRRAGNDIPVLIVTARDALDDRIAALDTGADDYVIKPFELGEMKARIRALARRRVGRVEPKVQCGALQLDPVTHTVECDGHDVELTAKEYALLHALIQRPGAVLSRQQLEARLYGWHDSVESNAVEFLLHGLRQKIGAARIKNVRGLGWRLVAPATVDTTPAHHR